MLDYSMSLNLTEADFHHVGHGSLCFGNMRLVVMTHTTEEKQTQTQLSVWSQTT